MFQVHDVRTCTSRQRFCLRSTRKLDRASASRAWQLAPIMHPAHSAAPSMAISKSPVSLQTWGRGGRRQRQRLKSSLRDSRMYFPPLASLAKPHDPAQRPGVQLFEYAEPARTWCRNKTSDGEQTHGHRDHTGVFKAPSDTRHRRLFDLDVAAISHLLPRLDRVICAIDSHVEIRLLPLARLATFQPSVLTRMPTSQPGACTLYSWILLRLP